MLCDFCDIQSRGGGMLPKKKGGGVNVWFSIKRCLSW